MARPHGVAHPWANVCAATMTSFEHCNAACRWCTLAGSQRGVERRPQRNKVLVSEEDWHACCNQSLHLGLPAVGKQACNGNRSAFFWVEEPHSSDLLQVIGGAEEAGACMWSQEQANKNLSTHFAGWSAAALTRAGFAAPHAYLTQHIFVSLQLPRVPK